MEILGSPFDGREQVAAQYEALDAGARNDSALCHFITEFYDHFIDEGLKAEAFYYRGLTIIQPTKSGKSRLIRNAGQSIPSFTIIFERDNTRDRLVPLADVQISRFFDKMSSLYCASFIATAFLVALFDQLTIYLAMIHVGDGILDLAHSYSNEETPSLMIEKAKAQQLVVEQEMVQDQLTFPEDVVRKLYGLRSLKKSENQKREFLLESIVDLATAILQEQSWTRPKNDDTTYLGESQLETRIAGFFKVMDLANDESPITVHPHQFILGLDRYAHLDTLTRDGVDSFIQVFHDLELRAKLQGLDGHYPGRRIWLAMLDTRDLHNNSDMKRTAMYNIQPRQI